MIAECPQTPTGVKATPADNAVTVSWNAVGASAPAAQQPTGYRIALLPGTTTYEVAAPATSLEITDLRNGVRYGFTVAAVNAAGTSAASAMVEATPTSATNGEVEQLIVAYEPGVKVTEAPGVATGSSTVDEVELTPGDSLGTGMRTVVLSESVDEGTAEQIANELTADPRVKWAEPDYFVPMLVDPMIAPVSAPQGVMVPRAAYLPSDPYFTANSLWGLNGTYGISAPDAWGITKGSASTVVAVLDTGSTVHPDLTGQTVAGYDMIATASVAADGNGRDADPSDAGDAYGGYPSSWHGTHVAGTINAIANNGVGVVGVAPDVKVQHVRVLGAGGGYTSDILAGITWASGGTVAGVPANTTPAKVINMSLGGLGACSIDWQTAINAAVARGTTIAVAAGNSGADASGYSPASCANVVTVAAIGSDGKRASFSNYGSTVEVAAPGVGIWSTLNTGTSTPGTPTYAAYSGTSMATPHVAGVIALMVSREPGLSPAQVTTRLTTASLSTAFPGGVCDPTATKTCGAGILNAAKQMGASTLSPVTAPGAPTGVTATAGAGSAAVSWVAPTSNGGSTITGYTARAFTALTGGTAVASCTSATTSCTITGLTIGTTYFFEVVATNVAGTGVASSPRVAVILATVPGAPTGVTATAGAGSAAVSWVAPTSNGGSAITGYTARAFTASTGGTAVATCASATTSCTITGLTNGTTTYIEVVATNAAGAGTASSPRVAVLPQAVPSAPTTVTATAGSGQLSVTWSAPTSNGGSVITGYTARAFTASTGGTAVATCASATTTCTITGLANGTTTYVEVVATNAVGTSAASSPRVAAVPQAVPGSPTSVAAVPGSGQLSMTWVAPANTGGSAITGYTARAFAALTGGTAVATCTSATTTCLITGLVNGTGYYVDVVATNAIGTGGASSPRVAATPRTVPGSPTAVRLTPGNTSMTVAWTPPASNGGSAITTYAARAFTTLTGGTAVASCVSSTTTCAISGLVNGTTYYVEVAASNVVGAGVASTPRVAGTPMAAPSSPRNVQVLAGSGQVSVAWTAPLSTGGSAITGYTARAWSASAGGTLRGSCTTTGALICVIPGLSNGMTSYVDVVATNAGGTGPASSPRVSARPRTQPGAVRPVMTAAQDRQVAVAWLPPVSDGGSPITGYTANAWSAASGGALLSSCTVTATVCTIPNLPNGTVAYVDVIATNEAGMGLSLGSRLAVVPRTVPGSVRGVSVNSGIRRLDVFWGAPASNGGASVTSYTVSAYSLATGGRLLGSCFAPGTTSCNIGNLPSGTTAYLDVVATNAAGGGPSLPVRIQARVR